MCKCETCKDQDWCSSEEMDREECPVRMSCHSCHSCDYMSIYGCTNGYKRDYRLTNKQAIKIVKSTELIIPEGRVKLVHDAFTLVLKAAEENEVRKFTIDELEAWLNEIISHNDNDFGKDCMEIISRLDGFENFVEDMRKEKEDV